MKEVTYSEFWSVIHKSKIDVISSVKIGEDGEFNSIFSHRQNRKIVGEVRTSKN